MTKLSRCSKCVMPETAESLYFDEENVCSVCHQIGFKHEKVDWEKRRLDLAELIKRHRGKYDYDCIVPFSGGKDSTFTLWYIVRELNLKPLVVRFDHGFLRPNVQDSSLRTFRRLGVDVLHFIPNWKVVRKLMFESLSRRGDFCWHCHTGIFSYPMWVAIQQKIPLIFWGEPGAEYSSYYSYEDVEESNQERFDRKINLGINAEDMVGMLDDTISDYPVSARDLKPYTYPPLAEIQKLGVESVFLGSFLPWDVKSQVAIIEKELNWTRDEVEGVPPDYSYEKIECFMQGVRDYIKFLKRGFGRTAHLASIDIRNGRLDRATAEKLVEEYDGKRPAALDRFLQILGISEAEFMALIAKHVVSPHQFPDLEDVERTSSEPSDFSALDAWINH